MSTPSAKRSGQKLAVTWRKAVRARDYLVVVQDAAGTIVASTVTRKLKETLSAIPAGKLTVRVTAQDVFGRPGKASAVKVG